jgi:hypothetical protein
VSARAPVAGHTTAASGVRIRSDPAIRPTPFDDP